MKIQQSLWCLPYDNDTIFKSFLKIPFSYYLNNLLSNEHFSAYQREMAKQLADRSAWNEKSWWLINFFQFLNNSFQIDKWDNYITFIQDNFLRNVMGYFRLWIDTQRMYIFNFLKLDSNEFQEDRIYLSLYRTLIFFNYIFSQYMYKDFDSNFLNNFIRQSNIILEKLGNASTTQTNDLISNILILLNNVKKKQKYLVQPSILHAIKKSAAIKVNKQAQVIKQVQSRLKNSSSHKKIIDEKTRLNLFIKKNGFIDQLTTGLEQVYDPLQQLTNQYQNHIKYRDVPTTQDRKKQHRITEQIQKYKKTVKNASGKRHIIQMYEQLQKDGRNAYSKDNYLIYGQPVKIDMNQKNRYKKKQEVQVISIEDYDRSKFYYDDKFIDNLEHITSDIAKVTQKDLNLMGASKQQNFKANDENTRVYNLKWHQDKQVMMMTRRSDNQSLQDSKDYDNNLLFKNPIQDEQLLEQKNNRLDKLRQKLSTKTYTIALLQQTASQIHPPNETYSYGTDYFIKKTPNLLDLNNFKLLNHNRFDFMKKVIGYSTAKKKINKLINDKNVPDCYPRNFYDVRQFCYNPQITYEKKQLAKGNSSINPQIHL